MGACRKVDSEQKASLLQARPGGMTWRSQAEPSGAESGSSGSSRSLLCDLCQREDLSLLKAQAEAHWQAGPGDSDASAA